MDDPSAPLSPEVSEHAPSPAGLLDDIERDLDTVDAALAALDAGDLEAAEALSGGVAGELGSVDCAISSKASRGPAARQLGPSDRPAGSAC